MVETSDAPPIPGSAAAADPVARAMQYAVDEAARLLGADGAFIDLIDPVTGVLRWAYVAGITAEEDRALLSGLELAPGQGLFGRAVAEGGVVATVDYLNDPRFSHTPAVDAFVRSVGIVSVVAAPLMGEHRPLGVLGVYAGRPYAFDERHEGLARALADHAAATMTTVRLIEQLARSRDELARRIDAERALRRIASRVTALRDPDAVLQEVVDQAQRLLGSDGAHLTLASPDGERLEPYLLAGADEETRAWFRSLRLPKGSGTNGLALERGETIWTRDWRDDARFGRGAGTGTVARRLGMVGIAAAPMRGADRRVIGTVSISYATPHDFSPDEIALLQALADQAAVAVLNSRLLQRVRASEARYRFLVENSPDLVFTIDADRKLAYISETSRRFLGYAPEELVGGSFRVVVAPEDYAMVRGLWDRIVEDPSLDPRLQFRLVRKDGTRILMEVHATPLVEDGRFAGIQGAARDMSEIDRLEQDRRRQAEELAVAQERAHLARELHDSVTQALFSMTLTTRTVELLLAKGRTDEARRHLEELRGLQRDALAEMRALIFALRPASLEQDGLVQALRTSVAALEQRTGLPVDFRADPVDRLVPEIEDMLYRVTQEALHNVIKHAHASRVRVALQRVGDEIQLSVEDDGTGFDPEVATAGRLGLVGMQARVDAVGGRLHVASAPGGGTRLTVRVPCRERPGTAAADAVGGGAAVPGGPVPGGPVPGGPAVVPTAPDDPPEPARRENERIRPGDDPLDPAPRESKDRSGAVWTRDDAVADGDGRYGSRATQE